MFTTVMVHRLVRVCVLAGILLAAAVEGLSQQTVQDDFSQSIRPVLAQNCSACHNPKNPKNRINFLKAATAQDVEANRGLWRNVATQLRNRTMPPVDSRLSEQDLRCGSTRICGRPPAAAATLRARWQSAA